MVSSGKEEQGEEECKAWKAQMEDGKRVRKLLSWHLGLQPARGVPKELEKRYQDGAGLGLGD